MDKVILCFPGQGAQKPQMGLDLYNASSKVKELFTLASDLTHLDLKKILEEADAATLSQTNIAQAAITLVERSAATVLEEKGFEIVGAAGFSLGELAAYRTSKVISEEDLFTLVGIRGSLMAQASENSSKDNKLSMAAIINLNRDSIENILKEEGISDVFIANDNSSRQVVISGVESSIDKLTPVLKDKGARRIVKLMVSSAFHSPFMNEAEKGFEKVLSSYTFNDPEIALYCNVSSERETKGDVIRTLASQQITHSVNWLKIMKNIERDFDDEMILEAGPGKVLSGLFKTEGIVCIPSGTLEDINNLRN